MLTFTCSGDNEVRISTCGSSGWSPDPGTFDCGSPVTGIKLMLISCMLHFTTVTVNCFLPKELSNHIIIVDSELLNETVLEGTVLTYQCDNRLSLTGPNNVTCTNALSLRHSCVCHQLKVKAIMFVLKCELWFVISISQILLPPPYLLA